MNLKLNKVNHATKYMFRTGFSQLGSVVAFLFSWTVNHSILWGMLHTVMGWFYVTYWLLKYSNIEEVITTWFLK